MIRPITVIIATILLLGPLLAAELGIRVLIETERLPIAPAGNRHGDISLANAVRRGQPDVMLLGTSVVRSGIKPQALENLIEKETGRSVDVQNVAQAGMDLESQRLLVAGLADQGLLPDIVITGLSPISLNGDNPRGDWYRDSPLGQLWSHCSEAEALETLECWLADNSALWRWRGRTDRISEAISEGMPTVLKGDKSTLQRDGWLAGRPATEKRLTRSLPWMLERVGEDVEVPDDVVEGWTALMDEYRAHGTQVVVVEFPYGEMLETELLALNPEWDAQRRAGYRLLEEAGGVDIIEIEGFGDWVEAGSFTDLRHLSREGAGPFTRQLWAMDEFRQPILDVLDSAR